MTLTFLVCTKKEGFDWIRCVEVFAFSLRLKESFKQVSLLKYAIQNIMHVSFSYFFSILIFFAFFAIRGFKTTHVEGLTIIIIIHENRKIKIWSSSFVVRPPFLFMQIILNEIDCYLNKNLCSGSNRFGQKWLQSRRKRSCCVISFVRLFFFLSFYRCVFIFRYIFFLWAKNKFRMSDS